MNLFNLLTGEITQQDLLRYYNASIIYEELPIGINGCVDYYRGINNIYINKILSYYKKKKTLLHELAHIELNQLGQSDKLLAFKRDQYEDEADKYIELLLSYINDSKI